MATPNLSPLGHSAVGYPPLPESQQKTCWITVGTLTLAMIAVYLDMLLRVSAKWSDPQYSHGFLIPILAAALLW